MKVIAFVGSARSDGHTYGATERFLRKLQESGSVESEIIRLSQTNLEICRGCKLCCDKGEELCPIKDDFRIMMEKLEEADGVIFGTPNYSFHVSGHMKVFLDRFAYVFHRPSFFGKTATSIVVQGIYGGGKIKSYFDFIEKAMGFNVVKGICLRTLEPMPEKTLKANEELLQKLSVRFYKTLVRRKMPGPSFADLLMFRFSRTSIKKKLDDNFRDYNYYNDQGWFESDFFYPVTLNPLMKGAGRIADITASKF